MRACGCFVTLSGAKSLVSFRNQPEILSAAKNDKGVGGDEILRCAQNDEGVVARYGPLTTDH